MDTYTVRTVDEYFLPSGEPGWRLGMQKNSDPGLHLYLFPDCAFSWRAAEYGLDPEDRDTLLDIILHEPYSSYSRERVEEDPAYRDLGLSSPRTRNRGISRIGDPTPVTLLNASSRDEARVAMLARIAHTKKNKAQVVIDPSERTTKKGVELNSERIKRGMQISLDDIEAKSRFVGLRRRAIYRGLSSGESKEIEELTNRLNLAFVTKRKGR